MEIDGIDGPYEPRIITPFPFREGIEEGRDSLLPSPAPFRERGEFARGEVQRGVAVKTCGRTQA